MAYSLNSELHKACRVGNLELVKALVQQGVSITDRGNLPARTAAGYGHIEILKYLIENGADVTDHDNGAIKFAALQDRLEIVKLLISHGANIEVVKDLLNRDDHKEVFEYLISTLTPWLIKGVS